MRNSSFNKWCWIKAYSGPKYCMYFSKQEVASNQLCSLPLGYLQNIFSWLLNLANAKDWKESCSPPYIQKDPEESEGFVDCANPKNSQRKTTNPHYQGQIHQRKRLAKVSFFYSCT